MLASAGEQSQIQMKLCWLISAHLLPCGLVPKRLQTGTILCPGDWGPLFYRAGTSGESSQRRDWSLLAEGNLKQP